MKDQEEYLLQQATAILEDVRRDFPHYRSALEGTDIRISRRLTRSAGNACAKSRTVGISAPIFTVEENRPQFQNTVLHELAHVIAGTRARAHGSRWRSIFIEIGGNGERCHEMRAKGQHFRHQAHCQKCGSQVEVGSRVWNRLRAGSRDYFHQGCRGMITAEPEDVERLDSTKQDSPGVFQMLGRGLRQAFLFKTTDRR
ncbi:MAG: SprT-like domain-containing protein [Planctomycetota bacterium]|nr:SprT-like domain-containing protein [Planctomycetota bacterium]